MAPSYYPINSPSSGKVNIKMLANTFICKSLTLQSWIIVSLKAVSLTILFVRSFPTNPTAWKKTLPFCHHSWTCSHQSFLLVCQVERGHLVSHPTKFLPLAYHRNSQPSTSEMTVPRLRLN